MGLLQSLIDSYSKEKIEVDKRENMFPYYFVRPISYFLSMPLIKMKVSANAVSIFSVFVALLGSLLIAYGDYSTRICGALLIFLWIVLDCVDGNLARFYKKPSSKGEFLDAMGGYVVNATVFMALSITLFERNIFDHNILIVGYVTTVASILPRLLHQKWMNSVKIDNIYNKKGRRGPTLAFIQNIAAVSNFFQVFLFLSILLEKESYVLFIYLFINVGIMLFTMVSLSLKSEK